MIIQILDLLKYVSGETENIKIAQGKYKLPDNIKEGYNLLKKQIKWESRKQ
tara:strand:+ start:738 stop:890 length:153 start_codon:yes stop_codon:yes gene_type:complete